MSESIWYWANNSMLDGGGAVVWPCEDGTMVSFELRTGFPAPFTTLAVNQADVGGALLFAPWLRRLAGALP